MDKDVDIATLAASQHGVFSDRQARLRLSRSAIHHRLASARWLEILPRVYRIPGTPVTGRSELMAAVLASGDGAVASHESAACLWGLPGFELLAPRVTVQRRPRRLQGIKTCQTFTFPSSHRSVVDDIPCTSVARTLFDLCGTIRLERVERTLDTALGRGLVTVQVMRETLEQMGRQGRDGTAVMTVLLAPRGDGHIAPESELEARFLRLVHEGGLPTPDQQVDLGDDGGWVGRVDFFFRDAGLVVEVDGMAFHDALLDRRADARRDARLRRARFRVERFRWGDVVQRPEYVRQRLRDLLEDRPSPSPETVASSSRPSTR
ncbi:MAG: DUF559 domain-containing protein [Actinobacteria bacterium]|nr:DUF559 domain-containing protein [Actinomycetota bacterium]